RICPSFPTRRSSDLDQREEARLRGDELLHLAQVVDELVAVGEVAAGGEAAVGRGELDHVVLGAVGAELLAFALGRSRHRVLALRSEEHTSELQSLA